LRSFYILLSSAVADKQQLTTKMHETKLLTAVSQHFFVYREVIYSPHYRPCPAVCLPNY